MGFVGWSLSPAGILGVVMSGASYADLEWVMRIRAVRCPDPWRVMVEGAARADGRPLETVVAKSVQESST